MSDSFDEIQSCPKVRTVIKFLVQEVFDSIPEQLNKKNKRHFLSMLSKEPKMRTYEDSIMWLIESYNLLFKVICKSLAFRHFNPLFSLNLV
jgi:hypothetical protein